MNEETDLNNESKLLSERNDDGTSVLINDHSRFFNRDLQWLEFNRRVLFQSIDPDMPLLERVRFLSIMSSNLDEFFMKRVGGLKRRLRLGLGAQAWELLPPEAQLADIRDIITDVGALQRRCFRDDIMPALEHVGINILNWEQLTDDQKTEAEMWYLSLIHI